MIAFLNHLPPSVSRFDRETEERMCPYHNDYFLHP